MSLNFYKNSNPLITLDLKKILEDSNSFNTSNLTIGEPLGFEHFFYVTDQNNNCIGFVFFKKNDNKLEIIFGKYEVSVRGFTDYILKNTKKFLQHINLERFEKVQVHNRIKVNNHHFDHLLKVAYLNAFKGQFDESQGEIQSMAQKMRLDPELGENILLVKDFKLI